MSKFHINSKGVPAPCKATKGNCPYGGASGTENHYDTVEEAQEAANRENESKHGILPMVKQNSPKTQFKFSKKDIEAYKNSYVKVNYDGKTFEGKVIDTFYKDKNDNGLIIEDENEVIKHIKNYRLDKLDKLSSDANEYLIDRKMDELENSIQDSLENFYNEKPGDSFYFNSNPSKLINKYFASVIAKEKGENVDLSKAGNHDFSNDVETAKSEEGYHSFSLSYDRNSQVSTWDSSSTQAYEEDLEEAEKTEAYVSSRKELIDEIVKEVKMVDWTKTHKTQQEGVIDVLERFYDSDIANE